MGIFGFDPRARQGGAPTEPAPDRSGQGAFQDAPAAPKARVRLLDILRGFSVVSMVAFHTMYDLVYFFGVLDAPWYRGWPGYLWQQSICWVFILVAGASLHYGRSPARHGFGVLVCAAILSAVTTIMGPQMQISFGVLHMYGCCILLFALLRRPLQRVPAAAGFAASFLLFALTKNMPYGALGFFDIAIWELPAQLYSTRFLFPLGFPGPGFYSSDYFPIVPWFFLITTGYYGWALVKDRARATLPGKNPLEAAGRHSLVIYMAHQPVIYGVLWVLAAMGVL